MGMFLNKRKGRPFKDELSTWQKIADIFLRPLSKHRLSHETKADFLDRTIFGLGKRVVVRVRAKKRIYLKTAKLYVAGTKTVRGYKPCHIPKDKLCFLRIDSRSPKIVDLEFSAGRGGENRSYRLSKVEWDRVANRFEVIDTDSYSQMDGDGVSS